MTLSSIILPFLVAWADGAGIAHELENSTMKQHNTHQGKPGESHKTVPANPKNPNKDPKTTHPIDSKEEVQQSNDEHIDQDFPGYPHHPSKETVISNGSANAFDHEDKFVDEDSDEDNDDLVLNRTQQ